MKTIIDADKIISEYEKLAKDEILNIKYKTGDRVEITKTSIRFGHSGLFFITELQIVGGRLYASRNDYLLGEIRGLGEIADMYNSIPAVGLVECGLGVKL